MSEAAEMIEIEEDETATAAATLMDPSMVRAVEAMLFASDKPLSVSAIRERLPDGADVGGMLLALQAEYQARGVTLVNIEGMWAFRTAADLGDALQMKRDVTRPLSRAAMETLAIVAYHQPVTRAEIENIRGVVTSGGTLDILMECGWVKPGRRRETPGRPLTWVTTTQFLDHFGLQALTDLPGLDDLKASGLLDRRPAIETTTQDMFDAIEAAEGESLSSDDGDEDEVIMTEEELAELKAAPEEADSDALSSDDAQGESEDSREEESYEHDVEDVEEDKTV